MKRENQILSLSNIITAEKANKAIKQDETQKVHRPFPQVDKNEWWQLFKLKAEQIMIDRKLFPAEFQELKSQTWLFEQLYFHFTGNHEFKGDVNKGIFLHGPNGTGKSIILSAYCEMYRHFGKNISYRKAIDLGLKIKNHEALKALSTIPLFIDDMGYESSEASDYGATIRPMANLLFTRYDLGAWTFATGQVPINSEPYLKKYGKAVVDRMRAMFNEFELKGESLRK